MEFKKVKEFDSIFNDVSLELIIKIYSFQSSKSDIKNFEEIINKFDIKEVYKLGLKYNKKAVTEVLKKIENTHYEELKELIDSKEDIIKEYKELEKSEKSEKSKESKSPIKMFGLILSAAKCLYAPSAHTIKLSLNISRSMFLGISPFSTITKFFIWVFPVGIFGLLFLTC